MTMAEIVLAMIAVLGRPARAFTHLAAHPRPLARLGFVAIVALLLGLATTPFVRAAFTVHPPARLSVAAAVRASVVSVPIGVIVTILLTTILLWILLWLGRAPTPFALLLAIASSAFVPEVLGQAANLARLAWSGAEAIAAPGDLLPAFGLNVFAPALTTSHPFVYALLRGVNPFSAWEAVLLGVGLVRVRNVAAPTAAFAVALTFAVVSVLIAGTTARSASPTP